MPSFLELVMEVPVKYLEEDDNMDRFPIEELLPNVEEIVRYDDFSGLVLYGIECHVKSVRLYKYKQYYIVYSFCGDGDDVDVMSSGHNYDPKDGNDFFNCCFDIYTKEDFSYDDFLADATDIDFIMRFYNNIGVKEPKKEMKKYFSKRIDEFKFDNE